MLGQVFSGTACKSINSPAVSDQAAGPCPSCGNGNVCSYYGNLGIRYGHCYTMKDTSGQEIRRDDGGASEGALLSKYTQADKEVTGPRGLVFRICNSTTNCNQKLDQYVPEGGYWFQLDEQGYRYEADPQPGWMVFLVNTYNMVVSPSPTIPAFYTAANFTGKGTCIFGECAICLQFGASGTPGWLGMTTYLNDVISAPNTRNCKQYYYEETNCIGPSSVAPKT